MKALIVSLKFSPGHYSHLVAMYKLFQEMHYDVTMYLDDKYYEFVKDEEYNCVFEGKEKEFNKDIDVAVIQNVSIKNIGFAKKIKSNAKIFYIYHEPWCGVDELKQQGFKQSIKLIGAHYFSKKIIKLSNKVILPSNFAFENYKKYDYRYNKCCSMIPLLFDDENNKIDIVDKIYFSYVGSVISGHAFDKYIDFVKYCLRKEYNIRFMITTKNDISNFIDDEIQSAIDKKILVVKHNSILSNEEINSAYKESFCIWNLYNRNTQSGVLPKAFMFNTPILATNTGSFREYVINDYNGAIIDDNNDSKKIYKELIKIRDNIDTYSSNSRKSFIKYFYYKTHIEKMIRLEREIKK